MKQPCDRRCPERSPTCHAECPRWAEYVRVRDEEYARRREEALVVSAHVEGSIRRGRFFPDN